MMLTVEEKNRIVDYFESWELALFLKADVTEFVEAFEDEIEDKLLALYEFMGEVETDDDTED